MHLLTSGTPEPKTPADVILADAVSFVDRDMENPRADLDAVSILDSLRRQVERQAE